MSYSTGIRQRKLTFRAHFNRINMQRGNPNIWTVHNCEGCFQVQEVIFQGVHVRTIYKANGRQPRAYLTGKAHLYIEGATAYLSA